MGGEVFFTWGAEFCWKRLIVCCTKYRNLGGRTPFFGVGLGGGEELSSPCFESLSMRVVFLDKSYTVVQRGVFPFYANL